MEKNAVLVKQNAATILREAARVLREEEKEMLRVNELVSGGMDFARYEEVEEQARAAEELAALQDIKKKHLMGLLSREEAIIAKHNLLEINKAKKAQIDKEKKEINRILKQLTQKHKEKMMQNVEKSQITQRNIEKQKKDMLDKKIREAQEVAITSRQLYEEAMLKQREELEAKMQIIRQIKELSSMKDVQGNKFDPTETMNWGLLCEMSLNELKERILLKKTSLKEEIGNRKLCIKDQRMKQQQFLMDIQRFIEDCRQQKNQVNSTSGRKQKVVIPVQLTENQDLIKLQEKLQKARLKRQQLEK